MRPEMVEWWRPPFSDEDKPEHFPPFLKHNCVVRTWTTGHDGSCSEISPTALCDGYMTWWVRQRGSMRRARRSTMSSSQHNCNILPGDVYMCATSPWIFHQVACSRVAYYSSVASFLLVSWPSKIGYLLSTSAQLSEPLAKSRTITGNSLTWGTGEKNNRFEHFQSGSRKVEQRFCWWWKSAYLSPDLPHGVAVSQGGRMRRLVHRVKVDGDAERHADLVRPGIAPADGARWVVHFVRDAVFRHGFGWEGAEGRVTHQPQRGNTVWTVCGYLHSSLTKGTNSWFELSGSTEHLYGATLAGKLKYCGEKKKRPPSLTWAFLSSHSICNTVQVLYVPFSARHRL